MISVVFSLFLFVTHVIGQSCSGTQYLTTVSGSITSNYGGEYASNAYCVWELLPPNSSYTYVEITFTSFDTWPDSDYVYVYNGPSSSSQKILQWSGWNLPDPSSLFSTQASMTIVFTSDGDVIQGTGFTALYQWKTGTPPPCTGTIEVTSGDSVLNVQYPSLPQSFECTYLIKSGWNSLDYDYTASATLNSFYDSGNSLEVSVYAITEGESIEWYDYPLATWNVWSLWGSSVIDDSFWGELPTLQIKVVGKAASSQSTSFSISYSFTRDNYLYGDGAVGIILGSIFGSLCCMAVCVVTVLAIQRQRSGSASSGFVFTSIFRKSGYSSVGSTPQGPSTVVVQTTTTASPSYHQPQYALPPMNPEFIASQQNTNPYPYYGSNA